MDVKTELARTAFHAGDFKEALRIASDFKLGLTPEERATLKRGYEAYVNPKFYKQLGMGPEKLKLDAQILFHHKFIYEDTQ